ncbi:peptidase M61 [Novosphingobium colocasiae]|uniref:Peptidase M61 n=2 Tax=Novosphingobium colocasiae TaxID=1256513 RepID=A0A918UDL7_9SPHN|nr:peptidase M61 [Novosphingobium colocasiae]
MIKNVVREVALASAMALAAAGAPAIARADDGRQRYPLTSPDLPAAADTAWPGGTIALDIDATDIARGLYRVTETIPLPPGTRRLSLLLPDWLPGSHGPDNSPAELVDLRFTVDGKPAPWRRDPVETSAFHIDLPEGAATLTARFVHTSPLQPGEGRVTMTDAMLNLKWEHMSLYPTGHAVSRIPVRPSVTLPAGWTPATALPGLVRQGNRASWAATDYATLIDSPIFAGANYRRFDLGRSVTIDAFADVPAYLALDPANLEKLRRLVSESTAVFGPLPAGRYQFLVALTNQLGDIGLEHLASSEDAIEPGSFIDWAGTDWDHNTLPHELVHAWNGKYRRPAGLATPDYRTPMQDDLLWVYEGQTQFWGLVLAVRSGVQRKDTVLGAIAQRAAGLAASAGRGWRPLIDTTYDPIIANRKPKPYGSLARGEDYYWEGALIWLEADQLIRTGTKGARGLDDFARAFFAPGQGDGRLSTYTFDDVTAALNAVYPYDWATFLRQRIEQPGQGAPYAGIERGGYRLVWRDVPNSYEQALMTRQGALYLTHSLGMELNREGVVTSVMWDGPAFNAGLVTGAQILGIDGTAWSAEAMKAAITRAKSAPAPIQFVVQRGNRILNVAVDYHGGLRWPWLEPAVGNGESGIDKLFQPRTK